MKSPTILLFLLAALALTIAETPAQTYPLRAYPNLGYFKCNEAAGATVTNTAFPGTGPGSYTFTTPGASMWITPGRLGASAINLSLAAGGTGQSILSGVAPNYGGDFTIEFWVRPEGATQTAILGDSSAGGFVVGLNGTTPVAGTFEWRGGGTTATNEYVVFGYSATTGVWQHIALVQQATVSQRRAYVNGAQVGTATFSPPAAGYPAATGLAFGGSGGAAYDWSFDEIRVWGRARTAAEILANYQAELTAVNKLTISQSGPLIGDLTVTLANVNPLADNGWTLLSADLSSPGSTGPALGIRPDATTWVILTQYPQGLGNPFHFLVPGGGLFPDTPFVVPAGGVLGLTGLTFDFVVLLTTNGIINSASNVVRYQFQ